MARNVCFITLFILIFSSEILSSQHECDRKCGKDEPRICYFDFTLGIDYKNETLTINGESPGRPIIVCLNDTIIVDVRNSLPSGIETSIHWHGLPQQRTPYMDGVPMVTQCPILPKTTFRYHFKAEKGGTYYYHAHSVLQQLDGLFGALIVRDFNDDERNEDIFIFSPRLKKFQIFENDIDRKVEVADLQIHGFGNKLGSEERLVKRIRLINAAAVDCPLNIFVNFVPFQLVAVDGGNIKPIDVTSLLLYPGERIDVIMKSDVLKITRIIGYNLCKGYEKYGLSPDAIGESHKGEKSQLPNYSGFLNTIKPLINRNFEEADEKIYIPFDESIFDNFNNEADFRYKLGEITANAPSFLSSRRKNRRIPQINQKSFLYPSSPILTQEEDVPESIHCSLDTESSDCENYLKGFCECLQVVEVSYNKSVDVILINEGKNSNLSHVFHIHGHSFHVLAISSFKTPITGESIKSQDASGEIYRNLIDPIEKDTIVVPNKGYVILRLSTNNPGYWLIESITSKTTSDPGLELILKIRNPNENLNIPKNFPKCGSMRGKDQVFGD